MAIMFFVDDHTIHNAYNMDGKYECMSAMHSLENILLDTEHMDVRKLQMNPEKMEFFAFGSRPQLEKYSLDKIEVRSLI